MKHAAKKSFSFMISLCMYISQKEPFNLFSMSTLWMNAINRRCFLNYYAVNSGSNQENFGLSVCHVCIH